jgi:hypothetical protein
MRDIVKYTGLSFRKFASSRHDVPSEMFQTTAKQNTVLTGTSWKAFMADEAVQHSTNIRKTNTDEINMLACLSKLMKQAD